MMRRKEYTENESRHLNICHLTNQESPRRQIFCSRKSCSGTRQQLRAFRRTTPNTKSLFWSASSTRTSIGTLYSPCCPSRNSRSWRENARRIRTTPIHVWASKLRRLWPLTEPRLTCDICPCSRRTPGKRPCPRFRRSSWWRFT